MRLPRILSISLLISIGTVAGIAQSPRYHAPTALPNPFATQPLPGSQITPLDLRALATQAKDGARALNPRTMKRLDPFVVRPNDLYALAPQGRVTIMTPRTLVAHNDERCYAIRDYRFSRVAPGWDATMMSGSSTCEPAGQVRLKSATAR
jgi:hypothetical protein